MAAVMFATHRPGHWWGDDWALYIRQAQGLLDGHPGRVFDENRFTVENSAGAEFSPPLYPWGFPLVLAPFVAIVGADVDQLAIVPVLCAAVFACCWYALAKPRLGQVPATVGVIAVTITPLLLSWTELIQSEWPFLAITGVALVWLDRVAVSGGFVEHGRRWAPLVLVGMLAAAAFSVRREGLAVFVAIAAAQIVALSEFSPRPWRLDLVAIRRLMARLAVPHAVGLAIVGGLQVILPSTIVPKYAGTGIGNVWHLRAKLFRNLAEISGLKRPGVPDPTVLGSVGWGWAVVASYLLIGYVGIGLALTVHRRRDAHVAAYLVTALVIGGSFRSAINRYIATIAPLLLLLGLVLILTAIRWLRRPRTATAVVTVLVALIAIANLVQARTRLQNVDRFVDAGQVEWGPTHPEAIAMFDAIRTLTAEGDVIAAPKARLMTLETGLLAVQVDDYRPIPPDLDLAAVVVEPGTNLAVKLLADPASYELTWQNPRFLIFTPVE